MPYDVPVQDGLEIFSKIDVLAAPPGLNDVGFDKTKTKFEYLNEGRSIEKVGPASEQTYYFSSY